MELVIWFKKPCYHWRCLLFHYIEQSVFTLHIKEYFILGFFIQIHCILVVAIINYYQLRCYLFHLFFAFTPYRQIFIPNKIGIPEKALDMWISYHDFIFWVCIHVFKEVNEFVINLRSFCNIFALFVEQSIPLYYQAQWFICLD